MASLSRPLAWALLALASSSWALQVTPGSACADVCLDQKNGNPSEPNASTTGLSDIVCNDDDYSTTSVGVKFKSCLSCLQTSTSVNGSESDTAWFLCELSRLAAVCVPY